jgi:NAD(P)-dependent dehydrogenase (short-subunit alcohol dehydrogenase family)
MRPSDTDTEPEPDPELYDSLGGQLALVTGANRGLGREIAARLADLGATIYAGTRSQSHDLIDEPSVPIDRTISTNLRGPLLVERDGGRVVDVSSNLGQLSGGQTGGTPSYRISKTGLNGLTAYLHGEYADEGLLANSVSPGWVATDLGTQGGRSPPRSVEEGAETSVWLCRFRPGSPAGLFWKDREIVDW